MDESLLLASSLLVLAISLLHLLFHNNKSLPPGRTGWPVLGESLEFLSTGWDGYPEKFIFDRMSKYSSHVFRTHLLGEKAAVLCGPHANRFLFSDAHNLVQPWWPTTFAKVFPSLSHHTSFNQEAIKLRKVLLPNFIKPQALVATMDRIAREHFSDGWENKEEVTVFPLVKSYTFGLACTLFLSIEDPSQVAWLAEPFDLVASGLMSVPVDLPGTPFNKAIKASSFIRKVIFRIIKQRRIDLVEGRASGAQDILSHMLTTSDENGESMHELDIADKILGLLIGGHDSASSTCTFIVKYLAELPHIYERVYKEQMEIWKSKKASEALNWEDIRKMKYSWNVACEVLRLAPPLQGTFREALTHFTYNGFSIPKGWKIYWSVNSTHRDPDCFPNPLKFDPSRFEGSGPAPYTYVPFGGGPRMCPGKEYARLVILVFMHHLVKRFKWEKIIPDEKVFFNPNPIPDKGLPVRLYPHPA